MFETQAFDPFLPSDDVVAVFERTVLGALLAESRLGRARRLWPAPRPAQMHT